MGDLDKLLAQKKPDELIHTDEFTVMMCSILNILEYANIMTVFVSFILEKNGNTYSRIYVDTITDPNGNGMDNVAICIADLDADGTEHSQNLNCNSAYASFVDSGMCNSDEDSLFDYFMINAQEISDIYYKGQIQYLKQQNIKQIMLDNMDNPDYIYQYVYADIYQPDIASIKTSDWYSTAYNNALGLKYGYLITDPTNTIGTRITNNWPVLSKIDKKKLTSCAIENTDRFIRNQVTISNVFNIMYNMTGQTDLDSQFIQTMKASTNPSDMLYCMQIKKSTLKSSACLLSRYEMSKAAAAAKATKRLLVIPSSTMELLVKNYDDPAREQMTLDEYDMQIRQINKDMMDQSIILGDKAWIYDLSDCQLKRY